MGTRDLALFRSRGIAHQELCKLLFWLWFTHLDSAVDFLLNPGSLGCAVFSYEIFYLVLWGFFLGILSLFLVKAVFSCSII